MSLKKGDVLFLKVHLIVYQLQNVIDPISTIYQQIFSKWNHCSIQVDNIVIHFYDDLIVPRWTEIDVDLKLKHPRESLYIGETTKTLSEVREFTNSLPNMRSIDYIQRYLSPLTLFKFPKKHNDCIHKCSQTLQFMFGCDTITSTPDKLLEYMKEYNANSRT
jgi:hypothetical protein